MSGRIEDRLSALKALPALEPPARLEQATLDAMACAPSTRGFRRFAKAAVWVAAIGMGALLALQTFDFDAPDTPDAPDPAAARADEIYRQLTQESKLLEQLLAGLPQRQVMRVSTAGTIVGLENQIAMIDAELARTATDPAPPVYRTALMRNRVEVMNALVNVRYAQSRAFTY